jgi:preprotein translocase subunit SecF
MEVSYDERPMLGEVNQVLDGFDFQHNVQPFGESSLIIRTRELSEADRGVLEAAIAIDGHEPNVERFNAVGPSIGKELRTKAIIALTLVAVAIVLFVALVFRHVSKPVSSWKYGIIAVFALLHDVLIPLGIFALLDKDITSLFVVGLLSILGLSVNDTIVVFDRIRENLRDQNEEDPYESFDNTVGSALKQTITRSINTSLTLVVVLLVLWIVGPFATRDLALVLLIGTVLGTYSSIFLASPLLVFWKGKKKS